ncbi:InlB B-repeat-containing protein, partial [Butyrivibrio sp. DSM 10294]|uniref:InlB B-repeat-containing protein n=1 Tax=Butyrivibrio sp. DSM 10294 TaxID=2972457 RepID=UPI00234E455A
DYDESLTYTVTYKSEDEAKGTVSPPEQVDQVLKTDKITGSKATPEPGYVFEGWYVGEDKVADTEVLDKDTAIGQLTKDDRGFYQDITFTAKFKPDESLNYIVTYQSENESRGKVSVTTQTDQVLSNVKITGSEATEEAGYKFIGWYKVEDGQDAIEVSTEKVLTNAALKGYLNTDADGLYTNTTFEARFDIDGGKTYKVFYKSKGNGIVDPEDEGPFQVLTSDGIEGSKAEPAAGYKFKAWYKTVGDIDTPITGAEAVLSAALVKEYLEKDGTIFADTTYTAEFEADPNQKYNVTYESNDTTMGTVTNDADEGLQVLSTEGVTGSKAEAKPGYRFVGWIRDGD